MQRRADSECGRASARAQSAESMFRVVTRGRRSRTLEEGSGEGVRIVGSGGGIVGEAAQRALIPMQRHRGAARVWFVEALNCALCSRAVAYPLYFPRYFGREQGLTLLFLRCRKRISVATFARWRPAAQLRLPRDSGIICPRCGPNAARCRPTGRPAGGLPRRDTGRLPAGLIGGADRLLPCIYHVSR